MNQLTHNTSRGKGKTSLKDSINEHRALDFLICRYGKKEAVFDDFNFFNLKRIAHELKIANSHLPITNIFVTLQAISK